MKSYFALGALVALAWVGLVAGAQAQDYDSGPSLLPLPEAQRDYPITRFPNTPVGAYQPGGAPGWSNSGAPGWSNNRGPVFGQRFSNNPTGSGVAQGDPSRGVLNAPQDSLNAPQGSLNVPQGSLNAPQGGPQGSLEAIPTPATPNGVGPNWSPSPSDRNYGPYSNAMSSPYGYGSGLEGDCGCAAGDMCCYGGGCCCCRGGWWASVGALAMGRDFGNRYNFSYFDSNEAFQTTRQQYNWGGGAQVTIGHCFCCCGKGCGDCGDCGGCGDCGSFKIIGVEAVYWGLYPDVNEQNTYAGQQPGNLNAILNFDQLNYNGGLASLSTDNAARHRLQSRYEVHNVEFNLLHYTNAGMGGSKLTYNCGAGLRWFHFRDALQFASDPTDTVFNGANEEIYYDISTTSDMIGFQLIGQGNYWLTNKLGATFGTKFGVFGNHIQHTSTIGGAAGYAVVNNGPFNGQAWNISGSTDTVAFLGELDFGLTYAIGCHWSVFGGYRVMGLSNIPLTTNQIYADLRGLNDVAAVNLNGSLMLHGAYAGVQFSW